MIQQAAVFAHRVLGECPRLRILATSREPLGITGEALAAEPLAFPEGDASPGEIESSPAVQLLRDRASTVRRDLTVDADTGWRRWRASAGRLTGCRWRSSWPRPGWHHVRRPARQPARRPVPPADQRQPDRAAAAQDAPRAMVDWSWELLPPTRNGTVLRRLSVFSGRERALEGRPSGSARRRRSSRSRCSTCSTALAEKSLLIAAGDRASRYRLTRHEVKGISAGQRLAEAGESDRVRHAHLAYFTGLTETAEPHLSPRRATRVARRARGRARQHRFRDARRPRGRRGPRGDAAQRRAGPAGTGGSVATGPRAST